MRNWLVMITIIVILFFSTNIVKIYGAAKQKLLIYGFKNVIEESNEKKLNDKLKIFLYDKVSGSKKSKYKVFIGQNNDDKNTNLNLSKHFLCENARGKGIDLVLYGFYDIKNEEIKIFPKILIVDRGIIVNVDKLFPSIYSAIKEAEKLGISKLVAYESNKKVKIVQMDYLPKNEVLKSQEKLSSIEHKKSLFHIPIMLEMSNYSGIIFPTESWGMLYLAGFFSDIDLSIISTRMVFPISLTFQTRYSVFSITNNGKYADSDMNMFYLGLGLNYNINIMKFVEAIRFSASGGFTNTLLDINNKEYESIDPTINVSFNMILRMSREFNLRIGIGGTYISYINYPFIGWYISTGVIFRK